MELIKKPKNNLHEYGALLALIILAVILSIVSAEFRTVGNILNLFRQASVNGLIAFGMSAVILTGGIDLAVGSTLALSGALCAGLIVNVGMPVPVAIVITLIFGTVLGLIGGVLVGKAKLQPFIATLVTLTVYRGFTLIYTDGRPISGITNPDYSGSGFLSFIGRESFLGIPVPVIIFALAFIAMYFLLNKTATGRKIYAVGSNETTAKLAGVNTARIKIFVYTLSGLMSTIAGLILISRLNSAQPTLGTGYELDAIAATAIGGTSMDGGRGKITGTLIGVLIIAVLGNGMNILGIASYYQDVVKGLVILVAVLVDRKK